MEKQLTALRTATVKLSTLFILELKKLNRYKECFFELLKLKKEEEEEARTFASQNSSHKVALDLILQ